MSSSLRIRNPSSHHLVPLHAHQKLEITLTSSVGADYEKVEAELRSDWLYLERIDYDEDYGEKSFIFSQIHDLKHFSPLSTHSLGEVILRNKDYEARLCVNLETTNAIKRDIITVINPTRNTIKIYPHQIVEVVCNNPLWGTELEWSMANLDGRMELLAMSSVNPATFKPEESKRPASDAFYIYPRCLAWTTMPAHHEYHFWLRIKPMVAKILSGIPGGINPVKLLFHGKANEGNKSLVKAEHSLEVLFNPRSKAKNPRSELVTHTDSSMREQGHSFGEGIDWGFEGVDFVDEMDDADIPECRPLTRKERKLKKQREKREIQRYTQHWDDLSRGYRDLHQTPASRQPKPVVQSKVSLVLKQDQQLEDGCRLYHAKDVLALAAPDDVPTLQELLDNIEEQEGEYAF